MDGRKALVFKARIAEQAERYEEMRDYMKELVKDYTNLEAEERNLLSVAYKNVIGSRRASWRVLSSLEAKYKEKDPDKSTVAIAKEYKAEVEKELNDICSDVLAVLDILVPKTEEDEAKVFFLKMKGDYCRYQAEFLDGDERQAAATNALEAYKAAATEAEGLPKTHPILLGLALNFSVFHYEILNNPDDACALAKKAFDDAIAKLESLNEDNYKDSTLIMQLLRDNLTLWTSDATADSEGGQGDTQVQDIENEDES